MFLCVQVLKGEREVGANRCRTINTALLNDESILRTETHSSRRVSDKARLCWVLRLHAPSSVMMAASAAGCGAGHLHAVAADVMNCLVCE